MIPIHRAIARTWALALAALALGAEAQELVSGRDPPPATLGQGRCAG